MKLLCVHGRIEHGSSNRIELDAIVEGTHNELHALRDKLDDANEVLAIKFDFCNFFSGIVPVTNAFNETSLRYTNVAKLWFTAKGSDVAQALNDVASNILHLIE